MALCRYLFCNIPLHNQLSIRHCRTSTVLCSSSSSSSSSSPSSMDSPPQGYRQNVGICLINPSKKIFAASRLDIPDCWQMPQGGIDEGEDARIAAIRELREETGVTSAEVLAEASELEIEAYPLLDELTSKISTLNLERVRRLKSRLVALTRKVQKVRDEIEQLMDDDGDMAEMYLTEKKRRMEVPFYGEQSVFGLRSNDAAISLSAPVSPVSSPPDSRRLEKCFSSSRSRHESTRSSDSATESIEELEMLLEAYFVVIDSTLNKLTSLKEYIEDTEDFINIQLDNVRNQLIQFELLLTTATFVVAIFGVIAGIFGMNFEIALFDDPNAFQWVLWTTGLTGLVIFGSFVWFFRYKRLMPL